VLEAMAGFGLTQAGVGIAVELLQYRSGVQQVWIHRIASY
jgi:hypothetical protein